MNRGSKTLYTNEYVHNFISIGGAPIGPHYQLYTPFTIHPSLFIEYVNPENLVDIHQDAVDFKGTPSQPFFFSNLSGGVQVPASWTLKHTDIGIGISETGDFRSDAINLWGMRHVISPELFKQINLAPGQSTRWSRTYHIWQI